MLKVKPSRLKPLPVTFTLFKLMMTEYTIGKIVTAAMTTSAGAEKRPAHPGQPSSVDIGTGDRRDDSGPDLTRRALSRGT